MKILILINMFFYTLMSLILLTFLSLTNLPFLLLRNDTISKYIKNQYIAIDQLYGNVYYSDPDQTISSIVGRYKDTNKLCYMLCKVIDFIFGKGHCEDSIERNK